MQGQTIGERLCVCQRLQRVNNHNSGNSRAASSRHANRNRELRVHFLNLKHEAENKLEICEGFFFSKPDPSGILPLARPYHLNLSNSATSWGPSIQMSKMLENISHSKHKHMKMTSLIPHIYVYIFISMGGMCM